MAVDEKPEVARAETAPLVHRRVSQSPRDRCVGHPWHAGAGAGKAGGSGRDGRDHLLLNPVSRFKEQVQALAEVVGLAYGWPGWATLRVLGGELNFPAPRNSVICRMHFRFGIRHRSC